MVPCKELGAESPYICIPSPEIYPASTNISSKCGCGTACSHVRMSACPRVQHSLIVQFATQIMRLHFGFVPCNTSIDIAAAICETRLTFLARFCRVTQPRTTTAAHKKSVPLIESSARYPINTPHCGTACLFRISPVLNTGLLHAGRTDPPVPYRSRAAQSYPVGC